MKLEQAQQEFPLGTAFISATKKIKAPLIVTELKYAEHLDREEAIRNIEQTVIKKYNENYHNVFTFKKIKFKPEFSEEVRDLIKERQYLLSIPKDIVEVLGGVIYCGETNTLAEKCEK